MATTANPEVTDLEVLRSTVGTALCQFATTLPLLLLAARDSGVPIEMPFDIVDGVAVWVVSAPRERLSDLGEQLETVGVPFEVERIGDEEAPEPVLTERQAALVEAAVERGYYDTPRTCSLTELADSLGLVTSTVSEVLQRAAGTLAKRYVGDRDRSPDRPTPPR